MKQIASPHTRFALAAALLSFLAACTDPPSWQSLLAAKVAEQYPAYQVEPTPDGNLRVQRPCAASVPVDVDAIARFCRRGPKDCNYGIEQMLLELRVK